MKAWLTITIALLIAFCGVAVGCDNRAQSSLPDTGGASAHEAAETGTLSFTLAIAEQSSGNTERVVVKVEGETAAGKKVVERYTAAFDQKYDADLTAGTYEFSLDTGKSSQGFNVYSCKTEKVIFDGRNDENVVLILELDAAATAAAEQAEAERIAAEAAQREAEERAAAEQAAAEQAAAAEAARVAQEQAAAAEAARVAQEQAAAQQAAAAQKGATVYIASSGKGSKYHTNPGCSNMKGTISLSVSDATARGYTPCKKCA